MKTKLLYYIRKKGLLICMFFLFVFAVDTYAQYYGTSRRVARRTARRTSRRHAAYNDGYGYGGAAAAAYITTLPAGCVLRAVSGIDYHYCGGIYYRPLYQGTTLVYEEVEVEID